MPGQARFAGGKGAPRGVGFRGSPPERRLRRGVNLIAKNPLLKGIPVDILISGKGQGEGLRHLPWAQKTLEKAGYAVEALQIPGDPERVIAETVQARPLGPYRPSRNHLSVVTPAPKGL